MKWLAAIPWIISLVMAPLLACYAAYSALRLVLLPTLTTTPLSPLELQRTHFSVYAWLAVLGVCVILLGTGLFKRWSKIRAKKS